MFSFRRVKVPAENIELKNVGNGLAATLDQSSVDVHVFGTESALSELKTDDIKGYVDCSNLGAGENQNALLQFENVNGVTVQNTSVTVTVIADPNAKTEADGEEEKNKED